MEVHDDDDDCVIWGKTWYKLNFKAWKWNILYHIKYNYLNLMNKMLEECLLTKLSPNTSISIMTYQSITTQNSKLIICGKL